MHRLIRLSFVYLGFHLILTSGAATAQGVDPAVAYEALAASIEHDGPTSVIVGLRVPGYRAEAALSATTEAHAQRLFLAAAQQRVLDALPSNHVQLKRRYRYLPFLALIVDRPGLDALAALADVLLIQPDLRAVPTMDESRLVIGADIANANGCDGSDWAVAILDTGVELSHNAFAGGKIISEACYSTHLPGSNQFSMCPAGATSTTLPGSGDDCSTPGIWACPHGSLIGGVVAGNGGGITGVAPEADLISIRVFTRYTQVSDCPSAAATPCALANASDVIAGLERVADLAETTNIASVVLTVDMSYTPGLNGFTSACDSAPALAGVKAAVDLVNALGIPVVGGTGNHNNAMQIVPPSCLSNVISVGYTKDGGNGTVVDAIGHETNSASFMDFWAPGEFIVSAWPPGPNTTNIVRGTSVASPHVAAAFAALRSVGPDSTVAYYKEVLEATGVPVTNPVNNVTKPRLDVGAACQALLGVTLTAKVFLEGPYAGAGMSTPVAFNTARPLIQPYGNAAYDGTVVEYDGSETVGSFPANTIDWLLVSLRTETLPASEVIEQPAFVLANGSLVGLGGSPLYFDGIPAGRYYVVIRHRNHLGVMSATTVDFTSGTGAWDFTTALTQAYTMGGAPMKAVANGKFAMFAAEGAVDGDITALDFNLYNAKTTAGATGYQQADFNLDAAVTALDFNLYNPNTTAGAASQVP